MTDFGGYPVARATGPNDQPREGYTLTDCQPVGLWHVKNGCVPRLDEHGQCQIDMQTCNLIIDHIPGYVQQPLKRGRPDDSTQPLNTVEEEDEVNVVENVVVEHDFDFLGDFAKINIDDRNKFALRRKIKESADAVVSQFKKKYEYENDQTTPENAVKHAMRLFDQKINDITTYHIIFHLYCSAPQFNKKYVKEFHALFYYQVFVTSQLEYHFGSGELCDRVKSFVIAFSLEELNRSLIKATPKKLPKSMSPSELKLRLTANFSRMGYILKEIVIFLEYFGMSQDVYMLLKMHVHSEINCTVCNLFVAFLSEFYPTF